MFLSKLKRRSIKKSEDNYSDLFNKINSLCDCLNTIYHTNSGGCCYVAYVIAEILEREDIQFEVLVSESRYEDEGYPDNFEDLDDSVYHICLEAKPIKDTYRINVGTYSDEEYFHYSNVTSQDIYNFYINNIWNSFYEIAKNKFIKYIINLIYDNFSSDLREGRSNSSNT